MELENIFRIEDLEPLASEVMDTGAYEYYASGAGLELTLDDNVAAFRRYRFLPRVLRGVCDVHTGVSLLGTEVSMPLGIAPAALLRLAHPEGELAAARAASRAGILMIASTESSYSLEEIAAAGDGPKWFQLYVHQDRGLARELVERAEKAGYLAIVLTVDLAVPGYREREYKHRFTPGPEVGPGNYHTDHSEPMHARIGAQYGDALSWSDIAEIKSWSRLPLIAKGIVAPEDAVRAAEHGCDAVVVSNHGARQLDQTIASVDALPAVVEAVRERVEVYLDGGIRRGTDVMIARALGARAVFIGRPFLWGLAAAGEAGVARVLDILSAQLRNGMMNLGASSVREIKADHLV